MIQRPLSRRAPRPEGEIPMKWYKFVIYFQLWFTLLSGVTNGLSMLTGSCYDGMAESLYETYAGLPYIDRSYGMILMGWGIFAVYVRQHLAKYMADGPKLYLLLLAINPVSALVYNLIAGAIVGGLDVMSLAISVIVNVIIIELNHIYFQKRQHLFVN